MPSYKNKSSGKWYCKFYYQDHDGTRKQKKKEGFKLKREAEQWEREFLESIAYQPNMKFEDFFELYKADRYPRLKETSKSTHQYRMKTRILPFFGDLPLTEITPAVVARWQNWLIEEGLSPVYQNRLHGVLSAAFNHAVRFYELKANPCHSAGSIGSSTPDEEMQFWTLDEYERFIIEVKDLKAKAAISTLYWSGLRKGELHGLHWSDLSDGGILSVKRGYSRVRGKAYISTPKSNAGVRDLLLPNQALSTIAAYKETLYQPAPEQFMFDWEKRYIENAMDEACKLSGVKRIRVHDLRHSHASLLINQKINILLVSKRLGHERTSMTLDIYSHLFPTEEEVMIDQLNALNSEPILLQSKD